LIVIIRVNLLISDDTNSAKLSERPLSARSGRSPPNEPEVQQLRSLNSQLRLAD
jgi:hypothetical protein